MAVEVNNIPESWLDLLGGRDASGWLGAFIESPTKAVDDLLWNAFYFGPLNLTERAQLLSGWLDLLNNSEMFAERLDAELTAWVELNWGQFDFDAVSLASAWSCLCNVVEFSSKLPEESRLKNCAVTLRNRFAERQSFLGSFSTAPASDPLGQYLAVVAEFQGPDRSLAAFWHRLCDLPDGVPFYHARYAMLGLRRIKAGESSENGTLRAEVVLGLLRLARAFDRLVRERGVPEHVAKVTFRRVASQTAAAYPNSARWHEHGLSKALELPERSQKWLGEAVPPLGEAMRREKNDKGYRLYRSRRTVVPDPSWPQRGRELGAGLRNGNYKCLPEVKSLLGEERRYVEATGDTYHLVRSLRQMAIRVMPFNPRLALRWAEEARKWAPDDDYSWNTLRTVLLYQGKLPEALSIAWITWKRFPQDVVAHTGLAEVLNALHRYDEAERVYRQTIVRFPNNLVARSGMAEMFKHARRYSEAEQTYREIVRLDPEDIVARNGLADTLRRMGHLDEAESEYRQIVQSGEAKVGTFTGLAYLVLRKGAVGRVEALSLVDQALALDPAFHGAKKLKQKLTTDTKIKFEELAGEWDKVADAVFGDRPQTLAVTDNWDDGTESLSFTELGDLSSSDQVKQTDKFAEPTETKGYQDQVPVRGTSEDRSVESTLPLRVPIYDTWNKTSFNPQTEPVEDESKENRFSKAKPRHDALEVAALVAEAYFFRTWAKDTKDDIATTRRKRAAKLLDQAEHLSPQNAQVLTERAALLVDNGDENRAYQTLTTCLGSHPSSVSLLVLRARLDRNRAQKENRRLSDATLAELCDIPQRLRDLDTTLSPLFHFQKGLAALSLLDGKIRTQTAAEAFSRFRKTVVQRAVAEENDRNQFASANKTRALHFHEWLHKQVDSGVFSGFARSGATEIHVDDMPILEETWWQYPAAFEEVEDLFADHLTFRTI